MSAASLPNLARIPAGEFLMGTADAEAHERPIRRVFVSEFLIGRFPVTNDEYGRFVRSTNHRAPAVFDLPLVAGGGREAQFRELSTQFAWSDGEPPPGMGSHPVVLVRYDDALAYCRWASREFGRHFRLPTEAEWEKAARGGVEGTRYPWGNEIDPSRCNFLLEPSMKRQRSTRPTGTFPPNNYGLYDVIGNVWEWIADWYSDDYYASGEMHDPHGPSAGALRIVRGGSWVNDDVLMLRSAYRHVVPPDTYSYSIGFRVACTP